MAAFLASSKYFLKKNPVWKFHVISPLTLAFVQCKTCHLPWLKILNCVAFKIYAMEIDRGGCSQGLGFIDSNQTRKLPGLFYCIPKGKKESTNDIELKNQHKTRSSPCCYCSEARHRTQALILNRKGFLTSTVNFKKKKILRKGQW